MSETSTRPVTGLSAMKLDELKGVASSMGIRGTGRMRKSDLVEAIKLRQSGGAAPAAESAPRASRRVTRPAGSTPGPEAAAAPEQGDAARAQAAREAVREVVDRAGDRAPERGEQPQQSDNGRQAPQKQESGRDEPRGGDASADQGEGRRRRGRDRQDRQDRQQEQGSGRGDDNQGDRGEGQQDNRGDRNDRRQDNRGDRGDRRQDNDNRGDRGDRNDRRQDNRGDGQQDRGDRQSRRFDDEGGDGRSRRSRNRQRNRDRKRGRRGDGQDWTESEVQVNEDDVLVPVAGILDVLDNYAFVRTSGYLPGPNDVYVPLGMVRKNGLRKGDAVTGAVKALRDGEQPSGNVGRQKFNALVKLDTVNGMTPEEAAKRVDFQKLTPLYPQQRLRLETESNILTTRIIDLVAPIGKGQRGLIVAPAKAGKTMVMQALANSITTNNPECHLMVVLVDERPEEVTDMQRAVKGEVISSTFDRPADDHTTVAELAIERAKRLVELGHDVVVLLDSITKLGRAYNLAAPASGRILSGGVDSAALYPPKKFFGAARNIENGGSLTILATALVETGSKMDEVIFEEFKGTGNMELRLSRELANRRIFPAVDINSSGTRREEILLASEELKIMWKLRRVLAALDQQQGIELLIDRLKKTKSNYEFLVQVQQTSSVKLDDEN